MSFFLRFTDNPAGDQERGCSYHYSDFTPGSLIDGFEVFTFEDERQYIANMFQCDADDITVLEGCYVQQLPGLCAFELEAENIEDAIEEAKGFGRIGSYNLATMRDIACIFEGTRIDTCPEGCVFTDAKFICKL